MSNFTWPNPWTPESDKDLIYSYSLTAESSIKLVRIKEIITTVKLKKLLIVKQIFLIKTREYVMRTVQRIGTLM